MPWQRLLLDHWLGVGEDGLWASPTIGAMVPRQQGKTEGPILTRVVYGIIVLKERVIFSSHRSDAVEEFFRALKNLLLQRCFSRFVSEDDFRNSTGREKLTLRNGASVEFIVRSVSGGRSKHADLIVLDEAQHLTASQKASVVPASLSRANLQIIETGTPPEFAVDGADFDRLRKRALKGEPNLCWDEWGITQMPDDVYDPEVWYSVMPSLGYVVTERSADTLMHGMEPPHAARELLGLWPKGSKVAQPAITLADWDACETDEPHQGGKVACGVKFDREGRTYSVSMAARAKGEPVLIECVDRAGTAKGVSGLADWLMARKDRLALVCIDGGGWVPTLTQRLLDGGFPRKGLHTMRPGELCDACSMLSKAAQERTIEHIAQPLLRESVASSYERNVGNMGWAFGGDDPTPVESCAMAHWAVMTAKRNPQRRGRVFTA